MGRAWLAGTTTDVARREDEDGRSRPTSSSSRSLDELSLGAWHARRRSTRRYFPSGRFVFVVFGGRRESIRLRTDRALVTRQSRGMRGRCPDVTLRPGCARRTEGSVIRARETRARGDRGPNGGFGRRSAVRAPNGSAFETFETFETFAPGATASVAGSVTGTSGVAFAEGSRETRTASLKQTTRSPFETRPRRRRDLVATYAIDHDDVVGLNYVNPLCADGRLAMEARRVVKRRARDAR